MYIYRDPIYIYTSNIHIYSLAGHKKELIISSHFPSESRKGKKKKVSFPIFFINREYMENGTFLKLINLILFSFHGVWPNEKKKKKRKKTVS